MDPLSRARDWLAEAAAAGVPEPSGAALATASRDGRPSVRYVLVRGIDERGLRFFTNYGSRKGRELDANPVAALALWWPTLQRQLRAEGPVERLEGRESDAYFASRGRGSQLGALASRQGVVIPGREVLDERVAAAERALRRCHPAPGVVGRLPPATRGDRVLGGPPRPAPRPRALPARGRRLAQRAAQPLSSAAASTSAS